MNTTIKNHPAYGRCLYADNGVLEIGIPLDFGLRVGHLSFVGGDNVFYVQPATTSKFCTEKGWRIRGGHRFWLAPESEKNYYPDNEPIEYEIKGESIVLTQNKDEWLGVIKSITLTFDDNRIHVKHEVLNLNDNPIKCSLWGISAMKEGGVEYIKLNRREGGYDPLHAIAIWDYASLGDKRATYEREQIILRNLPSDEKYKIGVRHPVLPIRYELENLTFLKYFNVQEDKEYPDFGVSYETYLSDMTEIESLSPLVELKRGESAKHEEVWALVKTN